MVKVNLAKLLDRRPIYKNHLHAIYQKQEKMTFAIPSSKIKC
jgi:hypothetical protein